MRNLTFLVKIMRKYGIKELEYYCGNTDFTDMFGFDIRPYLSVVRFDSGEMIVNEGSRPQYLYYIIDGRSKLVISHENGKVSILNYLDAPFFIGEIEMLQKQQMAKGVQAVTPCLRFAVDIARCEEKILNDIKFLRHLIFYFSRRSAESGYRQAVSQAWPLKNRLARFILDTSHKGVYRQRHTETAEYLGVTYRHLLYVIAEFVEAGWLTKTGRGYEITDCSRLKSLADVMGNN